MFLRASKRIQRVRGLRCQANCSRRRVFARKLLFDRLEDRRLLAADIGVLESCFQENLQSGSEFSIVTDDAKISSQTGLPRIAETLQFSEAVTNQPLLGEGEGVFQGGGSLAWIRFVGDPVVPEFTSGFVIGKVSVTNQTSETDYEWSVSDERFEVVDGLLRLREEHAVSSQSESAITFGITAKYSQSSATYHYPLLLHVLSSEHPSLSLNIESQYTVDEQAVGAVLGQIQVAGEFAEDGEILLSVNDSRLEIVENQLRVKESVQLRRATTEFFDIIVTAQALDQGVKIAKAARVHVNGDPTPYHNDVLPGDVDGDGKISPLDSLLIVNYINRYGPGEFIADGESDGINLDVNGDGSISPLDALIVINILNEQNRLSFQNPTLPSSDGNGAGENELPEGGTTIPDEDSELLVGEGEHFLSFDPSTMSDEIDSSPIDDTLAYQLLDLWNSWFPDIDTLDSLRKRRV